EAFGVQQRADAPQRRRSTQRGGLLLGVDALEARKRGEIDQRAVAEVDRREGMTAAGTADRTVGRADCGGELDLVLRRDHALRLADDAARPVGPFAADDLHAQS